MSDHKKKRLKRMNTLAVDANKKIAANKCLNKKYELYFKYYTLTKEIIAKCLTENNIPSIQLLTQYYETMKNECNNLANEYENVYSKFNSLLGECGNELSMGKPILEQKKNEAFTLNYLKKDRDNTICGLKQSIKSSKDYHLFREPKRDTLIDIRKGNKEMEKATNDLQQSMLYECKKCNKFNNAIKKYESKIIGMSKNIELLKNYIETNKYKVNNYKDFSRNPTNKNDEQEDKKGIISSERIPNKKNFGQREEEEYENNSDDDKGKETKKIRKKQNNIILEFTKVEDLFNISKEEGENEKIIDDELHSDDESVFENKVKPAKKISSNYLKSIKKSIPSFNFKQITFNRDKINEIDIYSLQRRQYKLNNIDNKIKEMKAKIEKITDKITSLKQKENIMREFVKKLEEKYEDIKPMLYQKSEINITQSDFILNSLNNNDNTEREREKDSIDLNEIPEVEEHSLNVNEEIEKVERKMEEKILKKVCKKKASIIKKTVTVNKNKNKVLVSLSGSVLKLKKAERPRSK
jgi:hypothetical protein